MGEYKLIQPGCIYTYDVSQVNNIPSGTPLPCFKLNEQVRLIAGTKAIIVPLNPKEQPYIVSLVEKQSQGVTAPISYWARPETVLTTFSNIMAMLAKRVGIGVAPSDKLIDVSIQANPMLVNARNAISWFNGLDENTQVRLISDAKMQAFKVKGGR